MFARYAYKYLIEASIFFVGIVIEIISFIQIGFNSVQSENRPVQRRNIINAEHN